MFVISNMNNNTMLIGGIVALVLVGGLVIYGTRGNTEVQSGNSTSTPVTTTEPIETKQPSAPAVTTSSKADTTETTAIVNGIVTPNGSFTSYWYEYGTTSSVINSTTRQMIGSGYATMQVPSYITGLTKNTIYYFRVAAENQYGINRGAMYTFKTTEGTPPPVGGIPSSVTLSASDISRTTANLNGEVTSNKVSTVYWFEYGNTANLGNTTAFVLAGNGSVKTPTSASVSNLDPGTTYYFRMNAQNQFGTVNGSILNFKTVGPLSATAPSVITRNASDIKSSTATLHGSVNPNVADTAYWFEYSSDSLLGSVLIRTTPRKSLNAGSNQVSVAVDVSGLSSSTTYYFRLVAENSVGTVRGDRESFNTK